MSEETFEEIWRRLAAEVGTANNDSDVIVFSGEIDDTSADNLIRLAKDKNRRRNVLLMLATRGGSPDAAFRIGKCLQRYYDKVVLYAYGRCKSAGTLIALAAHEIILSDFGELGPLDIQLGKRDELFESTSGLNITQALNSLTVRTLEFFRAALVDLRHSSKAQISTKLAAEIGTHLANGVYEKIYAQIDPSQLGAIERAMNIARDYGRLLSAHHKNLKDNTIDKLSTGYCSHNFVIDIDEAKELFTNVRQPTEVEEKLAEHIAFVLRDEAKSTIIQKLNEPRSPNDDNSGAIADDANAYPAGTPPGSDEDYEASNTPAASRVPG